MKRFVTGQARGQATLFPERLEDFVGEDNPVRVIDAFVEQLELRELGFAAVDPRATGRPAYHPAVLLKLYIDGLKWTPCPGQFPPEFSWPAFVNCSGLALPQVAVNPSDRRGPGQQLRKKSCCCCAAGVLNPRRRWGGAVWAKGE